MCTRNKGEENEAKAAATEQNVKVATKRRKYAESVTSRKGMANVNFTASYMPKISLEKKYKTLKTWQQE